MESHFTVLQSSMDVMKSDPDSESENEPIFSPTEDPFGDIQCPVIAMFPVVNRENEVSNVYVPLVFSAVGDHYLCSDCGPQGCNTVYYQRGCHCFGRTCCLHFRTDSVPTYNTTGVTTWKTTIGTLAILKT
jgi:hypothetical protein